MVDGAEPRHSAFEVCDEEASEDKDQKIQIKLGRRNETRQKGANFNQRYPRQTSARDTVGRCAAASIEGRGMSRRHADKPFVNLS